MVFCCLFYKASTMERDQELEVEAIRAWTFRVVSLSNCIWLIRFTIHCILHQIR
ncbi:hypothetical protein LINGRAHAP2_LOCUS34860, partial [Linum grandiflorum]